MHLSLKGTAAGLIMGAAVNLLFPVVKHGYLDKQRPLNPPIPGQQKIEGPLQGRNALTYNKGNMAYDIGNIYTINMENTNFNRQWMRQKTNPNLPGFPYVCAMLYSALSLKPRPITARRCSCSKGTLCQKVYSLSNRHTHTHADPINNYITDTLALTCGLLE